MPDNHLPAQSIKHAEDTSSSNNSTTSSAPQSTPVSFTDPTMLRPHKAAKKPKPSLMRTLLSPLRNPRLLLTVILIGGALLGFITVITYVVYANSLATPEAIINRKNSGLIFYDRNGKEFYRTAGARDTTLIPMTDIPDSLKNATVAIEDKDFYKHGGFSFEGIARAVYYNLLSRNATGSGGSTITQQLVKNALLTQKKSFLRKFQELVLSIEIDRRYSKDQILQLYLTSTYYGSNAYGVKEAAATYFNKPLNQLDLAQSAMIAGLPQAPSAYSPIDGSQELAKQRQRQVLDSMKTQSYISQDQRDAAFSETLTYQSASSVSQITSQAPHFVQYVTNLVNQKFGEDNATRGGYKVYTTLDIDLQQTAQSAVTAKVKALKGSGANNGALVAVDPNTGQVLAMVGSADYNNDDINGKFNVATALRQPGSSTKPFMYMTAFENGEATPATILHDVPTDFGGGYQPHDADGKYRGDVTVRRALANSLNIPAVEEVKEVGPTNFVNTMRDFGATSLDPNSVSQCGLAIVLGCAEVQLVDLTHAYATLADEGTYRDLVSYTKIMDKNGNQVYPSRNAFSLLSDSLNSGKQVMNSAYTYMISDILADNNARAEEFGFNSSLKLSRPASVKTGTTDDAKDAWAVGYTPQIAVGVWVGATQPTAMTIAGATGAAPIWHQVMESYLKGKPVETYQKPANVVQLPVCIGQEAIAQNAGGNTFMEYFAKDHIPTNTCNAAPTPTPTPSSTPTPESTDTPTPTPDNGNGDNGGINPTPIFPTPKHGGATPTPTPTVILTPTPTPRGVGGPAFGPTPTSTF